MNKNAIQKFAIWARNELIAQVSQRAYQYGVDESGFGDASADVLNGRLLTTEENSSVRNSSNRSREKAINRLWKKLPTLGSTASSPYVLWRSTTICHPISVCFPMIPGPSNQKF